MHPQVALPVGYPNDEIALLLCNYKFRHFGFQLRQNASLFAAVFRLYWGDFPYVRQF
jgi:hypothetical protein